VAIQALKLPLPIALDPSRNVTVPVALEGATLAVNVTFWPGLVEPGTACNDVVVAARLTTWLTVFDVEAAQTELPP